MCPRHVSVSLALGGAMLLALTAAPRAGQATTRRDAQQLKQKVAAIQSQAEHASRQPRRTMVTESEVNSYLAYEAKEQIPVGVVQPSVSIVGTGRLSGRAIVDLDAVRKAKNPTSLLDPMNYLMGRLLVTATGVLTTSNGVGHFNLESASIGSLPLPKFLLQEIVSYYSRTPERPSGVGLDDPFALPSRIREIQVQRGQAIIVQ